MKGAAIAHREIQRCGFSSRTPLTFLCALWLDTRLRVHDRSCIYSSEVDVSSVTPAAFRPLTQLPVARAKLKILALAQKTRVCVRQGSLYAQ